MEGQGAALTEMRRVLAPDGRLAINASGHIQPGFELMEQALVEHISPDLGGFVRAVFSMHDPDVVAGLLRGAGFTDVSATEQISALDLPGPADFLWQYGTRHCQIRTFGPSSRGLAPRTMTLVSNYDDHSPRSCVSRST